MDQLYYIKQYLKLVFQFLKTSKGMFLRDLKHFKYFKNVMYWWRLTHGYTAINKMNTD
jgi:hypothetical protein